MTPYIAVALMVGMPIILCWVFDYAESLFYPIDRDD